MEIPNPAAKAASFAKEFREFLFKTNVFSLALGVVIGAAVSKVVNSLVSDLIMPLVGVITPAGDWRAFKLSFWRFNFTVGNFLGQLLDFFIIGFVVFMVTKAFMKASQPPPPPPSKVCDACKENIHPDATRCKFCTSEQPKPAAPVAPGAGTPG